MTYRSDPSGRIRPAFPDGRAGFFFDAQRSGCSLLPDRTRSETRPALPSHHVFGPCGRSLVRRDVRSFTQATATGAFCFEIMTSVSITQKRLKCLLSYDPDTGYFTWNVNRQGRGARVGGRAGCVHATGYRVIRIDGHLEYEHRLAFIFVEGAIPPNEVDHINRVRDDNRWSNIRHATRSENQQNTGLRSSNSSGIRGVYWHRASGKWMAYARYEGRMHSLGYFNCKHQAGEVAARFRSEKLGEAAC